MFGAGSERAGDQESCRLNHFGSGTLIVNFDRGNAFERRMTGGRLQLVRNTVCAISREPVQIYRGALWAIRWMEARRPRSRRAKPNMQIALKPE